MKIEVDQESLVLYLKKGEIENFDFNNMEDIEAYFRTLLLKLEEYYHLPIEGFYSIHVYIDEEEGMVLQLEPEDMDYYPTFRQVEMRILKEEVTFLYQVEDILDWIELSDHIYYYQNQFYIHLKHPVNNYQVYEMGKLIYENTDYIMKKGILWSLPESS